MVSRLAPLIPALSFAFARRLGEPPEILRAAGRGGARHVRVLMTLEFGGPGTVSELGTRLGMSPAHASLVIGELADAGLVERERDPEDRRRVVVTVAQRARSAVAEMRRRNAEPLERFVAELALGEAEKFLAQLARLVELIDPEAQRSSDQDLSESA